ncbi:unnamed protein product [Schistocephalus solidus]|uniref:BCAS3 domain-containing protein n=1 Tax=Schistocephalus solidus TaxID=70667 RepID=A0A183SNJ9_SCHSO|nr:unnamed protein product [Schistocephalus solidus]
MDSVRDIFSDCFPGAVAGAAGDAAEELVTWAKFETLSPTPKSVHNETLVLLLGTNRGISIWSFAPVYHHMSRCGDASDDSSRPVATTMLNVNKRIWDSLSALASSVSIGNQSIGAHGRHPVKPLLRADPETPKLGPVSPSASFGANVSSSAVHVSEVASDAGYVTVVDIVNLAESYSAFENQQLLETPVPSSAAASASFVCCQDHQLPTAPSKPPDLRCRICHQRQPVASLLEPVHTLSQRKKWIDCHEFAENGAIVAHFLVSCSRCATFDKHFNTPFIAFQFLDKLLCYRAHRWANVGYLIFNSSGSLLFTACIQGHSFHIFRIANHPKDSRQTAVHHLYILDRGSTPCEVKLRPVSVRTHTHSHVVNRTSKYQRSSGLEEHHLTKPQPTRTVGVGELTSSAQSTAGVATGGQSAGRFPSTCKVASSVLVAQPAEHLQLPVCPHIGLTVGSVQDRFTAPTKGNMLQCACPPNANYNTTNSRLPPFPEPCSIQPEARLRPRLPSSASSNVHAGYAAAALSAATGAALEVASAVAPQTPQLVSGRYLFPAATGLRMAVCFHSPLCFLPSHQSYASAHHRPTREGRGPASRCTESLYVMTWDMHLVQFDLSVSAADPTLSSDKIYQDSPIKLQCTPMGQWHLRADSFLPPFASNHPLLTCRRQGSVKTPSATEPTAPSLYSTTARTISQLEPDDSTWELRTDSLSLSESMELAELHPKADSVSHSLPEGHSFTAAPEGWPKDAAASYWYSQVELTTHHRPLRRIWMGPQFTFRVYPFSVSKVPLFASHAPTATCLHYFCLFSEGSFTHA